MAMWDDVIPESDLERFRQAGMGELSGFGLRPVVLVVDMTYAFVDERSPLASPDTARPAVEAIKHLLDVARSRKVTIIYTVPAQWHRAIDRGRWKPNRVPPIMRSADAQTVTPELAPMPEDVVIVKGKPSAFFGTDLASRLTFLQVDTLIVTGMVTSGCIRATVVDAFSLNYFVIVPEECVADRGEVSHKVNLFDMHMKYADVFPMAKVEDYLKSLLP